MNLMEAPLAGDLPEARGNARWFNQSRFGVFVHYGLYSLLGRGEWAMYFEKIPREKYNKLADDFRAEAFDARELVRLAKRAGAGYMVFGTRHHEGFCLWDTKTTDFNSMMHAAGRDLVREYVEACRAEGLRVGLYYSIMSWQWPAIFTGPSEDPDGWEGMVAETHSQLRELMTDYGQIDYLWYDGCVVPGLGDAGIRAKYWRSHDLNEMIRSLQPDILINDRSALPEDVSTPEQHLTAPPRGRLWECCQTMGRYWGWHSQDEEIKNVRLLIEQMIFCSRYGGNLLLNIGPFGSGEVPPAQVERLEGIGRWLAVNGSSIRNSERTAYTEAQHLIGSATCHGRKLYFHLAEWPREHAVIAGIKRNIESIHLLGSAQPLSWEQKSDGCVFIKGLPIDTPIDVVAVIEVTLDKPPSRKAPPSLLVEHDTGRHDPAEAPVNTVNSWEMGRVQTLFFSVPTRGIYHLEFGIISEQAQSFTLTLDDKPILQPSLVPCGNYPTTVRLKDILLDAGDHHVFLEGGAADFGLYLWRVQPVWRILGPRHWSTIGPFPTEFRPQGSNSQVRDALDRVFSPESNLDLKFAPDAIGGRPVQWAVQKAHGDCVNLGLLCGASEIGLCYARTIITSPDERELSILLSCDWWANIFINGHIVRSERPPEDYESDGAWFNGWKPVAATVRLHPGPNVLLVKCHPGSTDNWFTLFLNDPGDLHFSPKQESEFDVREN
jgi:alpha-L-fucosidase